MRYAIVPFDAFHWFEINLYKLTDAQHPDIHHFDQIDLIKSFAGPFDISEIVI